jgi:hypothetical protein
MVQQDIPSKLYESVSATVLARRTGEVLGVVRRERRPVLVSVRGQVVAVIEPSTHREIAQEFDLDDEALLVSHRFLEQHGPRVVLDAVMGGEVRVQTFQNEPYAVWKSVEGWSGFDDLFADVPDAGPDVAPDATSAPSRSLDADIDHVVQMRRGDERELF